MKKAILALSAFALAHLTVAETVRFTIDDPMSRDTVQFKTTAPLEDIIGLTNSIKGEIQADLANLKSPETRGRVEVDLAGLKTGMSCATSTCATAFSKRRNIRKRFSRSTRFDPARARRPFRTNQSN